MPVFTVPACYAPEVEAAIAQAVRMIQADVALRDGEAPFAHGFIESSRIDATRAGTLRIVLEDVVDDEETEPQHHLATKVA